MSRKILVNIGAYESRAAIIEDGKLVELMYEIQDSEKIVGCIYKGRVAKVISGTQSAFVDIGIHKDAYLTLAGVDNGDDDMKDIFRSPIQDTLKVGQEVVLQILKEPTPTKGPRSTMTLSFPGRYLVFMPKVPHIGVSRRIYHDKERERLRQLGRKIAPKGCGVVFRTASEGLEENVLRADIELLVKMWRKVEEKIPKSPPKTMLHRDIPLPMKVARDFFTDEVEEMIVDSPEAFDSIFEDCEFLSPLQRASLELHKGPEPLFDKYDIEKQIERALSRKIWLDSGGYVFFDKTEAMHCIDVNSGRFSGGSDLEETVFRVNMEAAGEIARQIRLRNLSGMLIIDFIDMETSGHKSQVLKKLRDVFRGDRSKPNIYDFSELGLVQITRRRTNASLNETLKEVCPCCNGDARVFSVSSVCNRIKNDAVEQANRYETSKLIITAHKRVTDHLKGHENRDIKDLEKRINRKIILKSLVGFDLSNYIIEPVLEKVQNKQSQNKKVKNNQKKSETKDEQNDENSTKQAETPS